MVLLNSLLVSIIKLVTKPIVVEDESMPAGLQMGTCSAAANGLPDAAGMACPGKQNNGYKVVGDLHRNSKNQRVLGAVSGPDFVVASSIDDGSMELGTSAAGLQIGTTGFQSNLGPVTTQNAANNGHAQALAHQLVQASEREQLSWESAFSQVHGRTGYFESKILCTCS